MKEKISKEQAVEELNRFLEFANFDEDDPRSEEDAADLEMSIKRLLHQIQIGKVAIDDCGHAVVYTSNEELQVVTFDNRPKVSALRAMGKHKDSTAKTISMMADTLRIAPQKIGLLDTRDFSRVSLVFNFFLV